MHHTKASDVSSRNGPAARQWRPRTHGRGWRPTGISLVAGSIVGIAVWASLYLLGAAIASMTAMDYAAMSPIVAGLMGIYGCVAACGALWVAAYVTSHTADTRDRSSGALCGVLMWGLSTITMNAVVFGLGAGLFDKFSGVSRLVLRIGAAAVGCLGLVPADAQDFVVEGASLTPSFEPVQILWAMLGLIVVSLVVAVRGGVAGASQQLE